MWRGRTAVCLRVGVALLRPGTSLHVRCSTAISPLHGRGIALTSQTPRDNTMAGLVESHLMVLGTDGNELAPSLILFTDTNRYIFNCGENFQRLISERRIRTLRRPMVFATRVAWRNLGGLIGYSMFIRSSKKFSNIDLYGPEKVLEFSEVGCSLIRKESLFEITSARKESDPSNVYEDENLTITMVELSSNQADNEAISSSDEEDSFGIETEPAAKRMKYSQSNPSAAFICKLVDVRGKFDPRKAKEAGLPPGPSYRRLTLGESVEAPDGRIIHPSDVMGPTRKGPVMIVVECPNVGYIPSITSSTMLAEEAFKKSDQHVALIAHMSPLEVLQDDDYCEWMASFGESTKHLILNQDVCPKEVGLRSMMKFQSLLHMVDPSVYHFPPLNNPEGGDQREKMTKINKLLSKDSVIIGRMYANYRLKPANRMGLDETALMKPVAEELDEVLEEIRSNPTLLKVILPESQKQKSETDTLSTDESKSEQSTIVKLPPICAQQTLPSLSPDDALVTFLGTVSSVPSKHKNVSGILVQTPTSGNILLDCGEGSLSQIYRCFGKQLGDEIILNLNTVFISHIHADHHLGLISVLQRREELLKERGADNIALKRCSLTTIMPFLNIRFLKQYKAKCQEKFYFNPIECRALLSPTSVENLDPNLKFQTVKVIHCSNAYGVVIRHTSGWSIAYSGDTRPCDDLITAGQGATLLIHEATFQDELAELAEEAKHCTVSEALQVAERMNPGFTILTHFSQRDNIIPVSKEHWRPNVGVAFDCMSVCLKELQKLNSFAPVIKEILVELELSETVDINDFELPPTTFGDV